MPFDVTDTIDPGSSPAFNPADQISTPALPPSPPSAPSSGGFDPSAFNPPSLDHALFQQTNPGTAGLLPSHFASFSDPHLDLFRETAGENTGRAAMDAAWNSGKTPEELYAIAERNQKRYDDLQGQLSGQMAKQPSPPTYAPPTMNSLQAGMMGLGAILDPHHAAADVAGGLEGISKAHELGFAHAQQLYSDQQAAHEASVKNVLTQLGVQSGMLEKDASLQAELIAKQMQIQAQEQYRGQVLDDRVQNHLESQYERARGLDEMQTIGARLRLDPAAIARDYAEKQRSFQLKATQDWESNLSKFEGRYGADPSDAATIKAQKTAFASQYGVDPSTLRDPFTAQTVQQQRNAQMKNQFDRVFQLNQDKFAQQRLAEGQRLDQAKQRINQAEERLQRAGSDLQARMAVQAYQDATDRYMALQPHQHNAAIQERMDAIDAKISALSADNLSKDITPQQKAKNQAEMDRLANENDLWDKQKVDEKLPSYDLPMPTAPANPPSGQQQSATGEGWKAPGLSDSIGAHPTPGRGGTKPVALDIDGLLRRLPPGSGGWPGAASLPRAIPPRPPGMTDPEIIQYAHTRLAAGFPRVQMQAALDKWGVHGTW